MRQLNNKIKPNPQHIMFFMEDGILKCKDLRSQTRRGREPKIVLPLALVPTIFDLAHTSVVACHPGIFKTIERIKQYYFWPKMYAHIKKLVRACIDCLQHRAHKPKKNAELHRMPMASFPWDIVHMDISGPFPITMHGNRFILVFVCAFSKWVEAFPISNIESDTVAEVLMELISRYGLFRLLITDNGKQLVGDAITNVYKQLGMEHMKVPPYSAFCNGKCEKQHLSIKAALTHLVNAMHNDWDKNLKFALLALRSSTHLSTNENPHFIFTGRDMRLPYNLLSSRPKFSYNDSPSYCQALIPSLQSVFNLVRAHLEKVAQKQENVQKKTAVDKRIQIGDLVMYYRPAIKPGLCKKFSKLNTGPFRVIEKVGKVVFKIQLLSNPNQVNIAHVNHLSKIENKPIFPALKHQSEVQDSPDSNVNTTEKHSPLEHPTKVFNRSTKHYLLENSKAVFHSEGRERENGQASAIHSASVGEKVTRSVNCKSGVSRKLKTDSPPPPPSTDQLLPAASSSDKLPASSARYSLRKRESIYYGDR